MQEKPLIQQLQQPGVVLGGGEGDKGVPALTVWGVTVCGWSAGRSRCRRSCPGGWTFCKHLPGLGGDTACFLGGWGVTPAPALAASHCDALAGAVCPPTGFGDRGDIAGVLRLTRVRRELGALLGGLRVVVVPALHPLPLRPRGGRAVAVEGDWKRWRKMRTLGLQREVWGDAPPHTARGGLSKSGSCSRTPRRGSVLPGELISRR